MRSTFLIIASITALCVAFIASSPPRSVDAAPADNAVVALDDSPSYLVEASVAALEVLEQSRAPNREYTFSNGNRATRDFVCRQLRDAIIQTVAKERERVKWTPPYIEPVTIYPPLETEEPDLPDQVHKRAREQI